MAVKMTTIAVLVVLTIAFNRPATSMQLCPPNFCHTVLCARVNETACTLNGQGLYLPKGGSCGCCPICIKYLDEGSPCVEISDSPRTHTCRPPAVCVACDGDQRCSFCKVPPQTK